MISTETSVSPAPQRFKKKKYVPNDWIDDQLRALYAKRLTSGRKSVPRLEEFGKRIGWPKYALVNRARQIGLSRTKERHWSEEEIAALQKYAHLSVPVIARKLRQRGFSRSNTAIHVKLNRTAFRQYTDYCSATALARLMGIDNHGVTRWIRLGYLKAELKKTERTPQQGGDSYLISLKAILDFFLKHPCEYDLRKITDQIWFLDLVTGGKIAGHY